MAQAEFIKVQKSLAGISYPASKDDIVKHARNNKASDDVMDALGSLPDKEYDGPNEVSQAVAKEG